MVPSIAGDGMRASILPLFRWVISVKRIKAARIKQTLQIKTSLEKKRINENFKNQQRGLSN